MLPANILSLITEYLEFQALVAFSEVNRTYRSVAENPSLWRSECLRLWGGDLEVFGYSPASDLLPCSVQLTTPVKCLPWKQLLQLGVRRSCAWLDLESHQILSSMEVKALMAHCKAAFLQPEVPLPVLRREAQGFETVLQEFLAYGTESGFGADDCDVESAFDTIDASSDEIIRQFESRSDFLALIKTRWSIPAKTLGHAEAQQTACNSMTNSAEPNCPQPIPTFVILLLKVLRGYAKFQCEYHFRELQETKNCGALLSDYLRRWAAYSATAKMLGTTYGRFESLFNELYEALMKGNRLQPQFSIIRMMAVAWRRKVFDPMREDLTQAAMQLLSELRYEAHSKALQPPRRSKAAFTDDPRLALLSRVVQAFLDFSATTSSIHYLEHSLIVPLNPYKDLHDEVLRLSKAFLSSKTFDCNSASLVFSADIKLLQRIFLPCTTRAVSCVYAGVEIELWKEYFRESYNRKWPKVTARLREDVAEQHLNSPFGYFLFQCSTAPDAKVTIREFIEYIISEDSANVSRIERFNELAAELEDERPTMEDEELEFQMKTQGLDLNTVQRCDAWEALNTDFGHQECEVLLDQLPKSLLY